MKTFTYNTIAGWREISVDEQNFLIASLMNLKGNEKMTEREAIMVLSLKTFELKAEFKILN